ncbi:DUF3573 domain-containing protein [Thiotrichales bacterium 19S9-12]|nr:DUF3573 domain-containing protein [Thiotrichales bacterium 19S9-11]MCF6811084.1 DUF3573 domain-containing protein [Thiotrichales bacterium 19S9-12]
MLKRSVIAVSTAFATSITGGAAFADDQTKNTQMIEVSASDLQALKEQIQTLTKKVNQLEAKQNATTSDAIVTTGSRVPDHSHTLTHQADDKIVRASKQENTQDENGPQPLFRGQHLYIESSAQYNDTRLEQLSSSQLPLGILKLKERANQPALVIGGSLEADAQAWWGDAVTNTSGKPIYENGAGVFITTANVDMLANINPWTQGYITIAGTENSIAIDNAFITFGNVQQFPFFASVGKNRPPLGSFGGGGVWASSIGTMIFRPGKVSNITAGYNQDNLTTYLTGWRSTSDQAVNEYNFVYSAYYSDNITDDLAYSLSGGYMNNVIGSTSGSDHIADSTQRNPVVNVEGSITYHQYGLYAGLASTLFKRDYSDFKRAGTWYIQGVYSPEIFGKSTTFALSYNGSYQTQNFTGVVNGDAINGIEVTGPKNEVIAYVQSEIMSDVYLTLEYAWLQTYDNGKGNTITTDVIVYF